MKKITLRKAKRAQIGDRVIFNPEFEDLFESIESNINHSLDEILIRGKEYFISKIYYYDIRDKQIAKKKLFSDRKKHSTNHKIKNIFFQLYDVRETIMYDDFLVPQKRTQQTMKESKKESLKIFNKFENKTLHPFELLSTLTPGNNLGNISIDDYIKYLHYYDSFYSKISKKDFIDNQKIIPKNSSAKKEFEKLKAIYELRQERNYLDLEFIKRVENDFNIKTYNQIMLKLENNEIKFNYLKDSYNEGLLDKEEWLNHACKGSPEFEKYVYG